MDLKHILSAVDHTQLSPAATWQDIKLLCDDGIKYGTASVCIPASYVKKASQYVQGKLPICTVIGFPCGYSTTEAKGFEAQQAVRDGAKEIDMVINIGWLKDGLYDLVLDEIKSIRTAIPNSVLKVIIETCLLTDEEKIKMCELVAVSGADFIKTSTGFSSAGATKHDIELMASNCPKHLKIKAAGGIRSLDDAQQFLELGASRLGTSSIVKIVKEQGGTM